MSKLVKIQKFGAKISLRFKPKKKVGLRNKDTENLKGLAVGRHKKNWVGNVPKGIGI